MNLRPTGLKTAVAGMLFFSLQAAISTSAAFTVAVPVAAAPGKQAWERAQRLREQGRLREAEQVLSEFAAMHGGEIPNHVLAHMYNDLGSMCQDERRFAEAHRYYKQSVEEWEKSGSQYQLHAATTLNNLATLLWEDGRLSEAHKTMARSATIQVKVAGPFSAGLIQTYYNQGFLSMALNRFAEAEESYGKFLNIVQPNAEADYLLKTALVASNLGLIYRYDGRTTEAARHFRQSRRIWTQWHAEGSKLRETLHIDPVLLLNLAESFWKAGSIAEAAAAGEMALSVLESGRGVARPGLVRALQINAQILRKMKRKADARAKERRARQILDSEGKASAPAQDRIDIAALKPVKMSRRESRH